MGPLVEVNDIAIDTATGAAICATGDSNAYIWDLETRKCISALAGHSRYLHSVVALPALRAVATGSEDTTVKLWDLRSEKMIGEMVPDSDAAHGGMKKKASKASHVGALATDAANGWLFCGTGKGRLVQYHIGTRMATSSVRGSTKSINKVYYEDSKVRSLPAAAAQPTSGGSQRSLCAAHVLGVGWGIAALEFCRVIDKRPGMRYIESHWL